MVTPRQQPRKAAREKNSFTAKEINSLTAKATKAAKKIFIKTRNAKWGFQPALPEYSIPPSFLYAARGALRSSFAREASAEVMRSPHLQRWQQAGFPISTFPLRPSR